MYACEDKCAKASRGGAVHVAGCCGIKNVNECWWYPHSHTEPIHEQSVGKDEHYASNCIRAGISKNDNDVIDYNNSLYLINYILFITI